MPSFGNSDTILYFFSNTVFLFQLGMVLVISWYCNLSMCKNYLVQCLKALALGEWDTDAFQDSHHLFSFHGLYRRFKQHKNELSSFRVVVGALMLCSWPLFNIGVVSYVFHNVDKPTSNFLICDSGLAISRLYRSIEIIAFFYYGFFASSIYLVRQSFLRQMADIAKESPEQSEANIKSSITKVWLQLNDYRNVVGWWLCFAISIGVIGLTCQWKWAFDEQIDELEEDLGVELRVADIYVFWMWSNTLMLFSQPVVATGSYNVDYMWGDFKNEFMKYLDDSPNQEKLTCILRHMNYAYSEGGWLKPSIALTLLTVVLSVTFPEQFTWFWVRQGCILPTVGITVTEAASTL